MLLYTSMLLYTITPILGLLRNFIKYKPNLENLKRFGDSVYNDLTDKEKEKVNYTPSKTNEAKVNEKEAWQISSLGNLDTEAREFIEQCNKVKVSEETVSNLEKKGVNTG